MLGGAVYVGSGHRIQHIKSQWGSISNSVEHLKNKSQQYLCHFSAESQNILILYHAKVQHIKYQCIKIPLVTATIASK